MLAALSLFLGLLTAIPAIVIGILVITRGRGGAGAAIITLAIALPVAAAIVLFGVLDARAYRVPSEAMLPTVELGDRVVATKTSGAERGDILIFKPPAGADTNSCGVQHSERSPCPEPTGGRSDVNFIKRVAGSAVTGYRSAAAASTSTADLSESPTRGSTTAARSATCPRRSRSPRSTTS